MSSEDPAERPEQISTIINGLERYNPEAVGNLEAYLTQQCEERFCDCNANRTLLKLYVWLLHFVLTLYVPCGFRRLLQAGSCLPFDDVTYKRFLLPD